MQLTREWQWESCQTFTKWWKPFVVYALNWQKIRIHERLLLPCHKSNFSNVLKVLQIDSHHKSQNHFWLDLFLWGVKNLVWMMLNNFKSMLICIAPVPAKSMQWMWMTMGCFCRQKHQNRFLLLGFLIHGHLILCRGWEVPVFAWTNFSWVFIKSCSVNGYCFSSGISHLCLVYAQVAVCPCVPNASVFWK